jgi:hypothetical protein
VIVYIYVCMYICIYIYISIQKQKSRMPTLWVIETVMNDIECGQMYIPGVHM